jgi:hypothetical protein
LIENHHARSIISITETVGEETPLFHGFVEMYTSLHKGALTAELAACANLV